MLGSAVDSIREQTIRELDIMLVTNGPDAAVRRGADDLAARDSRVRVVDAGAVNLPAALNHGLREARYELVARMDDDDWSCPDRLAVQARALERDPALAAVGCAWEVVEPGGRVACTVRPPTDPRSLAWRLMLGNCLAHGSMLVRRSAVLEAGGYDESLGRAQDLALWLRLAMRSPASVGAVDRVLYQHRVREPAGAHASSPEQARAAAGVLIEAWAQLPADGDPSLIEPLAAALRGEVGAGETIGCHMADHGPSAAALIARLLADRLAPEAGAIEVCRLSRLRAVGARLRAQGVSSVMIWGAGNRGRWVAQHQGELGVAIDGFVDDAQAGSRVEGLPVQPPESLVADRWVLIASDLSEDAIWQRSCPLRARGVRVVRLYRDEA